MVFSLALVSLSGCIPRTVLVHDGVETTVFEAETKKPLPDAFVYDSFDSKAGPRVLARTNAIGLVRLNPESRMRFSALTLSALMGEALISQYLWICKEGYKPVMVGGSMGWNADYRAGKLYRPKSVELSKSELPPDKSCSEAKW